MEIDSKKLDMEKGFLEVTKDKQNEFSKMNKEVEFNLRKVREEKLLWESQKMELTHKNKLAQRKI
jgi:coiled-coil domain-containing protein 78